MRVSAAKRVFIDTLTLFTASCWAVEFTMTEISVSADEPFTLTWEGAGGPVEISLITGTSSNLETVEVIDSGDSGDSYIWTPSDDLPSGTYAFAISDGEDINYSPQWDFKAGSSTSGGDLPSSSSSSKSIFTSTSTSTSTSTPTPTPTVTTSTESHPTTTLKTTTQPATSTEEVSSSTNALTTESSNLPETTPIAGTTSKSDSQSASSSNIPVGSTAASLDPSGSLTSRPSDSSSNPSPSASSDKTQKPVVTGLSTGSKIGIGVGAGIGGFVLAALAGFLIYRRGKAAGKRDLVDGDTIDQDMKPELGGDPRTRVELGGQGLAELHSDQRTPELWQGHYDEWRRQPSELDATAHHWRGVDIGKV
ncbi:hypothetical protein F5Y03DRAFT_410238 [Xylaria venustula]|nr:hypothetical protein F5Y03DRAFT_410238 [Xylaria venustula]